MIPDIIEIPERIGRFQYLYKNGKPCCTMGHLLKAMDADVSYNEYTVKDEGRRFISSFEKYYARLYRVLTGDCYYSVEQSNDDITNKERVLLYAATLILLGYTISNFPEAIKLANKIK